jgi:DNA-binding transcriptional regulator YiaG
MKQSASTPISYIRLKVFDGIPQAEFGAIAGANQATVSRWETGESKPNQEHMQRIRAAAIERGQSWDDRWFFEMPQEHAA